MTVMLPPDLAELLAMTGQKWPDADEDQVVAMADGWRGLGGRLKTLQADNNRQTQDIVTGNQSQAIASFGERANEYDGILLKLVEICAQVEGVLIGVARAVLEVKKAILDALATLAKAIAEVKNRARDIPLVGGLLSDAIETLIEKPVALATQAITWVVEKVANLIIDTIVPTVVGLVRVVKDLVQNLRKSIKGTSSTDWPTNPSKKPHPENEPRGDRKAPHPNQKNKNILVALELENDAADTLAQAGYDIEQLEEDQKVQGKKNPDYRIEGEIFDGYAPKSSDPEYIWKYVQKEKIVAGQTERVVIDLNDPKTTVTVDELRKQFQENQMPNLREVKIIDKNGAIIDIYP